MTTTQLETQNLPSNSNWFSRVRSTIQSNVVETVTVSLFVSLALLSGSAWNTWTIYRGFKTKVTEQFQLQQLSGEIIHLDEVLTMSARMAASTGDLKWEDRYNQYVDPLDKAIKTVIKMAPASYQGQAEQTDAANIKLVELETKSFELVRQGRSREALEVLFSGEYERQKQIYAQGIQNTLKNVHSEIDWQLQNYRQRLAWSVAIAIIILIILLFSWLVILTAVRGYIRQRDRAQQSLEQSQIKLLNLNTELQQRSQELAAQERAKARENEMLQAEVGNILDTVSAVEEGDLRGQTQVGEGVTGLVADTLNRLVEEWIAVLQQVLGAARQVSTGSNNLEQIARVVARGAEQQAQAVNRVLNLSEAVERSAQDSAQEVEQTKQSLLTLNEAVETGQGAIANLSQGIGVLQQGTDKIIQQMKALGEFVGLADQFVYDQSEIAQKTQILALNASLVASRAAQQQNPRLFALVAREFQGIAAQVSQLSQQANEDLDNLEKRTNQIHTVVSTIDTEVQKLGGLVGDFTQGVQQSSQLFKNVQGVTVEAIAAGEAVAQSSQDIVQTTQATATALREITQLAQRTAQLTRDTRVQTEAMGQLSAQLLERVEFFRLPEPILANSQGEINGKSAPALNVAATEIKVPSQN